MNRVLKYLHYTLCFKRLKTTRYINIEKKSRRDPFLLYNLKEIPSLGVDDTYCILSVSKLDFTIQFFNVDENHLNNFNYKNSNFECTDRIIADQNAIKTDWKVIYIGT